MRTLKKILLVSFIFCSLLFINSGLPYDVKRLSADSEGGFNLVFCPLGYPSKIDFIKDIELITDKLQRTKPFDDLVGIGLYYLYLSDKEEDNVFTRVSGLPPIMVHREFVSSINDKLKVPFKLVIVDGEGSVSCAELSSARESSLIILGKKKYKTENSFTNDFLHELGHSLGLRDECVTCYQLSPGGYPNCAIDNKEAQEWWGDLVGGPNNRVGYISGCCGNERYIRPTIASLMNDPDKAEDFGPVNERYLRKELSNLYIKH